MTEPENDDMVLSEMFLEYARILDRARRYGNVSKYRCTTDEALSLFDSGYTPDRFIFFTTPPL